MEFEHLPGLKLSEAIVAPRGSAAASKLSACDESTVLVKQNHAVDRTTQPGVVC